MFKVLLFCLLFSAIVCSCGNRKEAKLTGKWKLVDRTITCDNPIEDTLEARTLREKSLPVMSLAEESADALKKEEAYTFTKDGKYTEHSGTINMNGNYAVKDSGVIFSGMLDIITKVWTFKTFNDSTLEVRWQIGMRRHNHTYNDKLVRVQ